MVYHQDPAHFPGFGKLGPWSAILRAGRNRAILVLLNHNSQPFKCHGGPVHVEADKSLTFHEGQIG